MKRKLILFILIFTGFVCGCSSRSHSEQSLLLQENRRLENALYLTHAKLVEVNRENETLRASMSPDTSARISAPSTRSSRRLEMPRDDMDNAPPYQAPQVELPSDAPGTNIIPDTLKSQHAPRFNLSNSFGLSMRQTLPEPGDISFPEFDEDMAEQVVPVWTPTR
ncbi:MAG: hypothetical protein ACRCUY_00535 [Thermoguttaceae bacterium]